MEPSNTKKDGFSRRMLPYEDYKKEMQKYSGGTEQPAPSTTGQTVQPVQPSSDMIQPVTASPGAMPFTPSNPTEKLPTSHTSPYSEIRTIPDAIPIPLSMTQAPVKEVITRVPERTYAPETPKRETIVDGRVSLSESVTYGQMRAGGSSHSRPTHGHPPETPHRLAEETPKRSLHEPERHVLSKDYFTDSMGHPITDDNNSLTLGRNGPGLITDSYLIEKLSHFNRERIPERVVHAKGTGAFGTFEAYSSMQEYTYASFLKEARKRTPVFARFSTVIGSKGSADTVRDPRGFAVKFYTDEGNYDLVGNDLPVFFIRDAIKFPDVIHSLKPDPVTNLRVPERFWDFISKTPEATHMLTWLYSDRGTIKSYRHVNGFGVNTYIWVNASGHRRFVKFHWITQQGLETIDRFEAEQLAGADPDVAVRDLQNAISRGEPVRYELCVQLMELSDAERLPFDPLDDTKVWPENIYPLRRVGMMTLDRNPDNFYAQVEQAAFCPGNIVPGIEISADKMLTGRSFAYFDTQRYRIGPNFAQLPINKPRSEVANYQQDGPMAYEYTKGTVNYFENTLNDNRPPIMPHPEYPGMGFEGRVERKPIAKTDDFAQAGERYNQMTQTERTHLVDNIASELKTVDRRIANTVIGYFYKASKEFGERVANAI